MHFNNFKRPLIIITSILIAIGAIYLVKVSWFSKKKNKNGKVLTIALTGRVDTINPVKIDKHYPLQVISNVAEPLLVYDYTADALQLVPNLLKSMPSVSKDRLVYTFKLKPGIYFQDHPRLKGKRRELTAEEVVFSLSQHMKKGAHYYRFFKCIQGADEFHQGVATHVAGMKILDKYTFQIVLNHVYENLLFVLAMPAMCMIAPESIGNGKPEDFRLIGTGFYTIKRMTPNEIELEKNPNARTQTFPKVKSEKFSYMKNSEGKQLPFIDRILFKIVTESTTQFALLKTGKVDLVPTLTNDQCSSVFDKQKKLKSDLKQKGFQVAPIPSMGLRFIAFNLAHPVFKKHTFLSKVITMAFDVDYALQQIGHGYGALTKGLIVPGIAGHDPNLKNPCAYDLKKAREILEQNGCKLKKDGWYKEDKKLPTIVFSVTQGNEDFTKLAELLKNSLQKLQITLEIKPVKWDDLMNKCKIPGNNHMMFIYGWALDTPEASDTLQFAYSKNIGSTNIFQYSDAAYDRWFEESQKLDPNSKECIALFKKMNKKLYDKPVLISLWATRSYAMHYAYLKNYRESNFMFGTLKYMDIDLAEKARLHNP